jgi:pyruvate dehydrogenase E1 component alpha subunit/2-oxoisovalerate dehydrogenase E1 component
MQKRAMSGARPGESALPHAAFIAQTAAMPPPRPLTREHGLELLRRMMLIRRFEEKCVELYSDQKIRGFLHLCIGEEAVPVGALGQLTPDEAVVSTYREHGHALIRGVSPGAIMAEMFGKQEGCARGRGGSMHLFDARTRFYGGNAIVGGGLPLAVGLALADLMQNRARATCCVFGEGAMAEGEFHESLNLASLWRTPVLFLCENNLYAMGTPIRIEHAMPDVAKKAAAYDVATASVDGMDVLAVEQAAADALEHIRSGRGPFLLECRTYRFRGHSMFDGELYRDKAEVGEWKKRDPIPALVTRMKNAGLITDADVPTLETACDGEVQAAVDFAESGTWEPVEDLARFVYSDPSAS